jgi:hypothetical protein
MTDEPTVLHPTTPEDKAEKAVTEFVRRSPGVPQKTSERSDFFAMIERLSSNPDVDVNKIEQIVNLQEHILDRNAKQLYNEDMVKAQSLIPSVFKNKPNEQTRSKYADFSAINKIAKPHYSACGFSLTYYEGKSEKENNIRVFADCMHRGGHTEIKWVDVPIDDKGIKGTTNKTNTHAKCSSLSYGKRYLICMIFNIATDDEDDDGNMIFNIATDDEDDDGNAAGGEPEYLSEKQLSSITDMINAKDLKGDHYKRFMKHVEAESTKKILAKNFQKAMVALKAYKKPERQPGED